MYIIGQLISCIGVISLGFLGFQSFSTWWGFPWGALDVLDPPESFILVVAIELHRHGKHPLESAIIFLRLLHDFPIAHLPVDPYPSGAVLIGTALFAYTFFGVHI